MNDIFSAAFEGISKILFTNRCHICGSVIDIDERYCDDCKKAPAIVAPRCLLCGKSKADCDCKKHKNKYISIVAPYYYKDGVRLAVNRLKRNNMTFLAKNFAEDMSVVISDEYKDIPFDYITYVPMRRIKQIKRGYNQSELIANELSKILNIQCSKLLIKNESTKDQKDLSARERRTNLYGAFDVIDYSNVYDKTTLIVDDVKTSGSTLNECAKMLNLRGAKAVYCAVYAVVHNEKKGKIDG